MQRKFIFEDMSFEWDDNKDRINFNKLGIHFSTAVKVFKDPNLLIREDIEHSEEVRYNVLGKIKKILFVVCLLKKENNVRLISARLATKDEKERYLENGED
ncbi:MAG: BrnT family toxin [Acidaminococcaceae bacterium]|nr:BrnT family toxin [Acidaminococcaceae bacterium]